MKNEIPILDWYEPLVLSIRFGRASLWKDPKAILLGALAFTVTVLAQWVFAPKGRLPLSTALSVAMAFGLLLYLLLPVFDLLTPVYIRLSSSHLTRISFLGEQQDIRLNEISKCQFYGLRVFGRPYTGMWVSGSNGQELLVGLAALPGKASVLDALRSAGVETEEIVQNA